jgi:hypothetical protein
VFAKQTVKIAIKKLQKRVFGNLSRFEFIVYPDFEI